MFPRCSTLIEMALFILLTVTLLFLTYTLLIHPLFFSPLSKLPNAHFTIPFTNTWTKIQRYLGQENKAIHSAHKRYGPIVRVGFSEISVNSAEALKLIYSDAFPKADFYAAFGNYGCVLYIGSLV